MGQRQQQPHVASCRLQVATAVAIAIEIICNQTNGAQFAAAARCAFINVITLLERCGPFNKKQQFTARNTRQYKWTGEQATLLDFAAQIGCGQVGYWGLGAGKAMLVLRTCIQDSLLHGMLTTVPELPGLDLILGTLLLAEH